MRTSCCTRSASRSAASESADARWPSALVDERRVPHRDPALGARRAVAVHEREVEPGQPLGQLDRVGDRRAREHEARLGAVGAREPAQAPQHVRHVGAEHAAVDVRLVDDDPGEVGQHVAPGLVVGEHAHVEHVGVREDQVRAAADRGALLLRRVAVVDRVAQELRAQARQRARLVLGERLRRVEVERARAGIARERVEHRQVEGERLAAGRAGGDDRVAAAGRLERVGLVRLERLDPGERLEQSRVEVVGDRACASRPAHPRGRCHELLVAPLLQHRLPGVGRGSGGHGLP